MTSKFAHRVPADAPAGPTGEELSAALAGLGEVWNDFAEAMRANLPPGFEPMREDTPEERAIMQAKAAERAAGCARDVESGVFGGDFRGGGGRGALASFAGGYRPQGRNRAIADFALEQVQSAGYAVTLRWVFYRLLQNNFYRGKDDYDKWKSLSSRLRHECYGGWRPDTLVDESRIVDYCRRGVETVAEWVADEATRADVCEVDHWFRQEHYVECWFEAAAMHGQFAKHTRGVTLRPFKGDYTIEPKWRAAKELAAAAERYGKPIVVCYFGDFDPKGVQIPDSALRDIRAWCSVPFTFERIGLNDGDGERLGIPENYEGEGYQWEALDDPSAEAMIQDGLAQYMDLALANELNEKADEATELLAEYLEGFPDFYEDNRDKESVE